MTSVIRKYTPKTMCDFGCGPGLYVQTAWALGVDAWGVEPFEYNGDFQAPGRQIVADLTESFDLGKQFDLTLCLEVAEHVPDEYTETVLDNVVRHTGSFMLFSAGTPGEDGIGHVNLKTFEEWNELVTRRGFHFLPQESDRLRAMSNWPWFRNHLTLYAKET